MCAELSVSQVWRQGVDRMTSLEEGGPLEKGTDRPGAQGQGSIWG